VQRIAVGVIAVAVVNDLLVHGLTAHPRLVVPNWQRFPPPRPATYGRTPYSRGEPTNSPGAAAGNSCATTSRRSAPEIASLTIEAGRGGLGSEGASGPPPPPFALVAEAATPPAAPETLLPMDAEWRSFREGHGRLALGRERE